MTDRAIKLQCPACHRHLKIPRLNPKKAIICPKCDGRFRIDAQQQVQPDAGRKGWFGPSADRAVLNDAGLPAVPEIQGAFDDIDHLLAGDIRSTRLPSVAPAETVGAPRGTQGSSRNQRRDTDSDERGETEKCAKSKSEERFQRNGLGLLVLATGLALLPFVGRNVDGLQSVLPYLPLTATGLAFVGSFLLACSLRRGNLAAVLFSSLPFLLIGMVGLGGYYYQSAVLISEPVADQVNNNGPVDLNRAAEGDFEPDESDAMDFDLSSIEDNPAANFVPPRHEQPLAAGKKPVMPSQPENKVDGRPENRLAPAETSDHPTATDQIVAEPSQDSALANELKSALEISLNAEKVERLRDRIANDLSRGHVNGDTIVSPAELRERFDLSEVAGQTTVYGVAYFLPDPIAGVDVAFSTDGRDRTLELIVPIINQPDFGDSIVPIEKGAALIGLNVNVHPEGVVGIQGVFAKVGGHEKSTSQWAGQQPGNRSTTTIEAGGRKIHGIVAYRNQLKVVGVALLLDNQAD